MNLGRSGILPITDDVVSESCCLAVHTSRAFTFQFHNWMTGLKACMFGGALEPSGDQIRWRFLHRAAVAADHEHYGFTGVMLVIAREV
jgi:hypothetical protein